MGLLALLSKPAIWPMKEGQLLVGLQHDNWYAIVGFLSAAAIRTMVQQGWLRREGPYLHVTEAGRATARRDFVGAYKPPHQYPQKSTIVLTTAAYIPGPTSLCPTSKSIH
jgi:hypothetical protein